MVPSDTAEQYVKVIHRLTEEGGSAKTSDIASALGIAPASVTEMLQKLSSQGYLKYEPYRGASLRPKGRRLGRRLARKHRLLECFLQDFMGIGGRAGHEQACKMEHVLSDEAESGLCRMMQHPAACPQGRRIPKCDRRISCEKCTQFTVPLSQLSEGQSATISHIASSDRSELCRLLSMGFVPGSEVKVERRLKGGGPIVVDIAGTKVAVASSVGQKLHVMKTG